MEAQKQFITDQQGNKVAIILPINDYEKLVEQLEDIDDVRLYDKAKKEDDGERISFSDYLKSRSLND